MKNIFRTSIKLLQPRVCSMLHNNIGSLVNVTKINLPYIMICSYFHSRSYVFLLSVIVDVDDSDRMDTYHHSPKRIHYGNLTPERLTNLPNPFSSRYYIVFKGTIVVLSVPQLLFGVSMGISEQA